MSGASPSVPPGRDLLADTAELVEVPSVSHHEDTLAGLVEARLRRLPHLEVARVGDNVVARTSLGRSSRLVLAGHLDTVPPAGNERARVEGDWLWGLGAADMKGGLAVMLALAEDLAYLAVDMTLVFYACEEVERRHNGLLELQAAVSHLLVGDAAVLGEPTGSKVEAGCQGVLKVEVRTAGTRAHAARPWMGVNALHRLGPVLDLLAAYEPRRPVIDGCEYAEALQAVAAQAGVASNVIPDLAKVEINHRFAPDRDAKAAFAWLSSYLDACLDGSVGDEVELVDSSPSCPPSLGHPLLKALGEASGSPPRAKLGWTDVAFFAERGIPAANFGPGDPELAHRADERVTRSELERAYHVLSTVLSTQPGR